MIGHSNLARREERDAAAFCDAILTGPSSWWQTRLRQTPGAYTAGMVRALLERMRTTLESSPANALQITSLAIEVADELDVSAYPSDSVVKLRGEAYRDHAYVLVFLGRIREAEEVAARARLLFTQIAAPEHDLARLDLVDATILSRMERTAEAIEHARRAADTFQQMDDRTRCLGARIHEGGMLFNSGQPRAALEVWSSIDGDPALGDVQQVRLLHNIALSHVRLGQPELAVPILQRCAADFEVLGLETERTRSRWCLAQALAASGRNRDAIAGLRQAWKEFDRLEVVVDAALAALDLAEQLLVAGETAEVPAICRVLIAKFTEAAMPSRAVTALAFLREAVAVGQATPSLIQHVHAFLRELPSQPDRAFAPPPAHRGG